MSWTDYDEALSFWRTRIEELGIFVFSTKLPREDCRGFSFGADSAVPVIVVNDEELPQAQIFTLLHEYAHLMRRDSAICLEDEESDRGQVERFCNQFAAAVMMPPDAVDEAITRTRVDPERDGWSVESITSVARRLKVSRLSFAIRLRDLGYDVVGLYEEMEQEWRGATWRVREPGGGGPIPIQYRLTKALGARYIGVVLMAHERGSLTPSQACELLGSRRIHFERLGLHAASRMQRFGRR